MPPFCWHRFLPRLSLSSLCSLRAEDASTHFTCEPRAHKAAAPPPKKNPNKHIPGQALIPTPLLF